jgi:hypothetical protein
MNRHNPNGYWKTVVDSIQDGVMIVDPAGRTPKNRPGTDIAVTLIQRNLALSTFIPLSPNPLGLWPGLSRTPGPEFFPGMVFGACADMIF